MLFQGDAPEGRETFQWPVIERDRVGGLRLIIWDKVKVPLCLYWVMHRKRVTSELHDSYFRLMTIKHSISKIEWASNDYITQLSSTASWVADSWRRDRRGVVRKATPGRRGPRETWLNWGPEKMLIRFSKGSQHPAEWDLGLRLNSPGERERHNAEGYKFGVKILQLCSISSSLSQLNPSQPFRTLTNKVRGIYICKEVFLHRLFLRLLFIASVCIQHIYVYFCMNQQMSI